MLDFRAPHQKDGMVRVSKSLARQALDGLRAYREDYAATRPADMPAINAAIHRYEGIVGGERQPDEAGS